MIALDTTIENVALPSIRADLGFSEASLARVVNAYLATPITQTLGSADRGGKLGVYTHRLKAWSIVLSSLDEQTTFEVLNEFIEPMATVALNLPYVLRSRFIFATAHLAHQANRARDGKEWQDNLPLDRAIAFQTADTFGAKWQCYLRLKQSLERISGKDYQEATFDFRNKYNHRFSPRVVIGHIGSVTRIEDPTTKKISYSFGEAPPFPLERVASLLDDQCRYAHDALEAFKVLVIEFKKVIEETAISSHI